MRRALLALLGLAFVGATTGPERSHEKHRKESSKGIGAAARISASPPPAVEAAATPPSQGSSALGTMITVAAGAALLLGGWVALQKGACVQLSLSREAMFFLSSALVLNALTAPMVKLTQNDHGGYDFNQNCVYFFAELLKILVAGGWSMLNWRGGDDAYSPHTMERGDVLAYAVPGFVFFAQNNLSFVALQHMSSAAFQLLLNLRIITVAILTVLVLGKSLNSLEWMSVTLLTIGAMQYQLSSCSSGSMRIDSTGTSVILVIVMCAAFGNIYTQKVMQKKMAQPLMLQNAVLYSWGVLYNGVNWMQSVSRGQEAFGAIGFWQCTSIAFYALYGLSISVIIKQFGSVTRTFVNTAAVCLTAGLDVTFL